jgi:hypothetical protein
MPSNTERNKTKNIYLQIVEVMNDEKKLKRKMFHFGVDIRQYT